MSRHPAEPTIPALLLLTIACGGALPTVTPTPASQHGTFRFSERVAESSPQLVVEGVFTVTADTIVVDESNPGPCFPIVPASTQVIRYRCGPLVLGFDRRQPLLRSGYTIAGTALESQRVCIRTTISPTGQVICAQYGQERVQVARTFSGRIRGFPL